jgi:hypothetical protein
MDLTEYRTDSKGNPTQLSGLREGFFLTARFATVPLLLHPEFQSGSRFRYIGTTSEPVAHVIAFAQVPEVARIHQEYQPVPGPKVILHHQGLIWVDPASYQIIRMYTELLEPRTDVGLENVASDIRFQRVSFKNGYLSFWLPSEVKVSIRQWNVVYRNRHRYSDYRLFTVESNYQVRPPHEF